MVRFSSNVKRPKAVIKQNNPLISKEAPANIGTTSHNHYPPPHAPHGHSRSLLSNNEISIIQEIGLSSSQAMKKLIEEIDRLLRDKRPLHTSRPGRNVPVLRYLSLLTSATWALWKLENWSIGIFCISILAAELLFIEFIERLRAKGAVLGSIKTIRSKLRKLDKSLLSGKSNLDSVYSLVPHTYKTFKFLIIFIVELQCTSVYCHKLHESYKRRKD